MTARDEVYGLFCAIPSPVLVEVIGCAGYDFVILDTEHSLVDPQQWGNLIRAAEAVDLTPFVRVPETDPATVLRCLDAGAMGAVIAHVRRRAGVDAAIRAARYAPEGMRSLGSGRVRAIPRILEDHAQWRATGVRAFVLGEERGLAARALRAHLANHRLPGKP